MLLSLRDSAVGCAPEDCVFHGWADFQSGLEHSIAPGKGPECRWTADHAYLKDSPAQQSCRSTERHAWTVEERNWS